MWRIRDVDEEEAAGGRGCGGAEAPLVRVGGKGVAASGWGRETQWWSMWWREGLVGRAGTEELDWKEQEVRPCKTVDLDADSLRTQGGWRRL